MTRIEIAPYSESWPKEFQRLARKLRSILGDRAVRIDHIGSTSVPGLAAKDRIDIQVTVASLDDANPLGAAGYEDFDICEDHRPPDAVGTEEDWAKRFFNTPDTERPANVHVRVDGRAQLAADGRACAGCTKGSAYFAWEDYRGVRGESELLVQRLPAAPATRTRSTSSTVAQSSAYQSTSSSSMSIGAA